MCIGDFFFSNLVFKMGINAGVGNSAFWRSFLGKPWKLESELSIDVAVHKEEDREKMKLLLPY